MKRGGGNISHLYVSRTCKKSLNRKSAFTRESVLSISSSSRRLPMIHTPWAGPRGESELSFPTTDPSTVPSSRFPAATYIPFVVVTTMRLTTFAPAERTAEINRFFFFSLGPSPPELFNTSIAPMLQSYPVVDYITTSYHDYMIPTANAHPMSPILLPVSPEHRMSPKTSPKTSPRTSPKTSPRTSPSPSESGSGESVTEEVRSAFVPLRHNTLPPTTSSSSSSPDRNPKKPIEGTRNELKAPTTLISETYRSPTPTKISQSPAKVWRPYSKS